jgi:hypothetical protein
MIHKHLVFLFLLMMLLLGKSNSTYANTNYLQYHQYINKAEHYYFIDSSYDSAAYYYKKAFNEFDFCFAKDCLITIQLALYEKKYNDFEFFINKAFENGIVLDSLKSLTYEDWDNVSTKVSIFDTIFKNVNWYSKLKVQNEIGRKKYLNRINKDILLRITSSYIEDQINKNTRLVYNEKREDRKSKHSVVIKKNMKYIDSLAKTIGLPMEKMIGIEQADILNELGYKGKDKMAYFKSLSSMQANVFNVSDDVFSFDPDAYSNMTALVLLLHYPCFYFENEKNFLSWIKSGNIHPREIGISHIFLRQNTKEKYDEKVAIRKLNFDCNYPPFNENDYNLVITIGKRVYDKSEIEKINDFRNKILINDYEVDCAMRDFEITEHLKVLSYGFFQSL